MKTSVFATTRSFQGGATFATFNVEKFNKGVVLPIKKLLDSAPPEFRGIAVVSCGEHGSKYAEEVRLEGNANWNPTMNDEDPSNSWFATPTIHYLHEAFPKEIAAGLVVPILCRDWGLNAGSATAINAGIAVARERDASDTLVWSPEINLDGFMLKAMLSHKERNALKLVGYMRSNWFLRLQWQFAQNTCALWDLETLKAIGDMNPDCNGDGITVVSTPEFGDVALAGMEDFEAYLRASRHQGEFLRWGNAGVSSPADWDLSLKEPGTPEYDNNAKKIARQGLVMNEYARRIFPEYTLSELYRQVMKPIFIG